MQTALTLILGAAAVWIIATTSLGPDDKRWAHGTIGALVGYWAKGPELTNWPPGTHKRTKVERSVPEPEADSTFSVFGDADAWTREMTGNTCLPYTPDRDRIGPTNTGLATAENTVGLAEYAETPTDRFSDRPFLGLCVPGGQFVTSGRFASYQKSTRRGSVGNYSAV
jgi:hypothetical protein